MIMSALPWRPRRLTLLAQITLTATHRKHRTNKGSVCLPVPGTHTSSFSWATEGWRRVGRANRPTENGESEVAEEEQEQGTKGEETHRRTDGRTDADGGWEDHEGVRARAWALALACRRARQRTSSFPRSPLPSSSSESSRPTFSSDGQTDRPTQER